jgi:hypothetical protein
MMSRSFLAGILAVGMLSAAACASSTKFKTSWANPEAKPGSFQGEKIAALVMSDDKSLRFSAEAALARELTKRGVNGVPAYTVVPVEVTQDEEQAKKFLQEANVTGVVSMRVVGTDKEMYSTPGYYNTTMYSPYYGSFWGGYWGYGWGAVYTPGTLRMDTIVSVETLIYDLEGDMLVWAGMSATTNPSDLQKFIKELVTKTATEVRRAGLVAK